MNSALSKRELTIRIGGILMVASPLFNLFVSVAFSTGVPNKWGFSGLALIFGHMPTINWFLYASSLVIGAMMMKGRRASWAFVLVVLGIYILYGGLTLYQDIKQKNVQPILAMAMNCALFTLVYMQEFHQRVYGFIDDVRSRHDTASDEISPASKATETIESFKVSTAATVPKPSKLFNPLPLQSKNVFMKLPLLVNLDGVGTWAKLMRISADEIQMHALKQPPSELASRTIELRLPTEPEVITLHARLVSHQDQEYTFQIVSNPITAVAA